MLSSTRFSEIRKVRGTLYDPLTNTTDIFPCEQSLATCICTYVYTRRSESHSPDSCLAGFADLGRRLEKAAPRYFQFRAVVSPRLRATKQLAIRLDGTFSTFNSHGETGSPVLLAGRIHTVTGKDAGDGEMDTPFLSSPLSSRIERVRIQMRCNDHDIQESCCTLCPLLGPRRGLGITVFPTVRKPFGYIDREDAQNVSTLQRFARSSYLSSSLGFSPQDAISFVEVMRWLNRSSHDNIPENVNFYRRKESSPTNLNDFDVPTVPKVSVMSLVVAKQQFRTVFRSNRDVLYRDDYGFLRFLFRRAVL
ncbi:hypothetical protein G5I_05181 [Acromyrmex echinatior]|uniref:Uncharacterized protein n=1 Tax=Acromyrmex echinatior TaxID=103372 RepID=F4WHL8_ACREC|nr:hypothetical protein G5I_05181 [Acromyrmex echinatior]